MTFVKGGIFDASGQPIQSVRLVTDADANSGIGSVLDPIRIDPTGTTVQPVSGTVTSTVSGTVAVSNFPATQAVSIAVMPTTPVTGSFFQATQPVSIASMPTTPVTGTFFQATQPVSGTVGVNNFPATQAVSIAVMPTTPVTGSFFQATQPVSIASMPTTPVTGTFFQATQPVSNASLIFDAGGSLRVNTTGAAGSFKSVTFTSTGTIASAVLATVPAGKKWVFVAMQVKIVSSATVATRQGGIFVQDSLANSIAGVQATPTQAASLTDFYTYGPGLPQSAAFVAAQATIPFPAVAMGPGFTISDNTISKQTGDVVSGAINVIEYSN